MRRSWTVLACLAVLASALAGCGGSGGAWRKGAVAADHELASQAGVEILKKGGNAVDAAVATSFTLSVVRPYSCGIGGGGFMVIHLPSPPDRGGWERVDSGDFSLNYRETAPSGVGAEYYLNHPDPLASRVGATAAGVPGTVAGLMLALERYGRLDRKTVLAPAIRAAEKGFVADEDFVRVSRRVAEEFATHPEYRQRFAFVWTRYLREGNVAVGDRITNPEQAAALELIAEQGAAAFYRGPIADAVVTAAQADGGTITHGDLGAYRAVETVPLRFQFDGRTILTMPPPSSGGVAMAEALRVFAAMEARAAEVPGAARTLAVLRDYAQKGGDPGSQGAAMGTMFHMMATLTQARESPYVLHPLAEAFKHAFADRAEWLGDPAVVDVPAARLMSDGYARERAATFNPAHTLTTEQYGTRETATGAAPDDSGTSHFSVIDGWGNAVACTETINTEFGSFVCVEPFGFLLNNEMDDFTTRPGEPNAFGLVQSARNAPAPGKRPLSSMTPTIALGPDGKVEAVLGASGGPRIITATTQVLLNVTRNRGVLSSAQSAVSAPRIHHQWSPDVLELGDAAAAGPPGQWSSSLHDSTGLSIDQPRPLAERMRDLGHSVKRATSHAVVQLILRGPDGTLDAASDPRKGGKPAGY